MGETELSPRVVRCWDVRRALILESSIQVFGCNDFSLFDLFVEDGVGERFLLVKQGDVTSRILADSYLGLAHGIGWAFRLDLVDDLFKLDGQVFGERARILPGQDARQIILGSEWAMRIVLADGLHAKALVEICDKFRQIGIACRAAGDAAQAHLLDQPILQGLVGALDTAFGLWSVGADDLDIEVLHSASELGQVVARDAVGHIDPEDAVFVAVEGHGLAVALKISTCCCAIAEKALAFHE